MPCKIEFKLYTGLVQEYTNMNGAKVFYVIYRVYIVPIEDKLGTNSTFRNDIVNLQSHDLEYPMTNNRTLNYFYVIIHSIQFYFFF